MLPHPALVLLGLALWTNSVLFIVTKCLLLKPDESIAAIRTGVKATPFGWIWRVVLLLLGLYILLFAGSARADTVAFGLGGKLCAQWTVAAPAADELYIDWALGWWTGANESNGINVGSEASGFQLIGEMKAVCREHPGVRVEDSVKRVYVDHIHKQDPAP